MNHKLFKFFLDNKLSPGERAVAEVAVEGATNREIAEKIFRTEKTVRFHMTNIYKKLAVKNRHHFLIKCIPYKSAPEFDVGPR